MLRPLSLVLLTGLILAAWAPAASANQVRPLSIGPAPMADLGNGLLERADQAFSPSVMLAMGGYAEPPRQYKHPRPPQNHGWGQYGYGYYGHGNGPRPHPHNNGYPPRNDDRPPMGPDHR